MDDRLPLLEERLRRLDEAFDALCARVSSLEAQARPSSLVEGPSDRQPPIFEPAPAMLENALPILTLVGRTFLVFGGAYLLRALTESRWVPLSGGVLIGFAYASAWIGVADRAAIRRPASGVFHGLTSLLIACPLVLEASTRFAVLSPAGAALVLAGFTSVAFGVAWHRQLSSLAVIAAVVCSLTAVSLAWTTGQVLPFALAAILASAVAETIGALREWRGPARIIAFGANFLVLDLVVRALRSAPDGPFVPAVVAAILLGLVYGVMLVWSAVSRSGTLFATDIALSLASVCLGLGGALAVSRVIGPGALQLLGGTLLVLGGVGYGVSISMATRWSTRASAVLTSLAGFLVFLGAAAALSSSGLAAIAGISAVALFALGDRRGQPWLAIQGACFAVALAIASSLFLFSIDVWTGELPSDAISLRAIWALVVLIFGALAMPLLTKGEVSTRWSPVLTTLVALGAGALAIQALDAFDGQTPSASILAAERSVVLAGLVIALTALSRASVFASLKWLGYGVIVLATFKLAAEDLRVSSALALFVALAAYGTALIASAKLLSKKA